MKTIKKFTFKAIIVTIIVLISSVVALGTTNNTSLNEDENQNVSYNRTNEFFLNIRSYTVNDKVYGIISGSTYGDGIHDDTDEFQKAIDYCARNHTSLYIPRGTYLITKQLLINDVFNVEGDGKDLSILKAAGTGEAMVFIKAYSRMSISNLSIQSDGQDEAFDCGIKIERKGPGIYPGYMEFSNVEVKGLQKENSVALFMDDCSHMSFTDCSFSTKNGTAFSIEGNNYNTGVFDFKNTVFGNASTDKYGLEINTGACIDSITFESCYFGGRVAAEKLGDAYNVLRTITHYACKFENSTPGDTQIIELWGGGGNGGGYGLDWHNCTFSGSGKVKSAFKFTYKDNSRAWFRDVSILDCIFDNISTDGYIINNCIDSNFISCKLKIGSILGTSPLLFSSMYFKDDTIWSGGWTVINNYTEYNQGILLNKAKITFALSMPRSGNYDIGDIVLNSGKPVSYEQSGKKYIIKGWKRKTSGNTHILNTDWLEMRAPIGDTSIDIKSPSKPANLVCKVKSASSVELSWDASIDESGITGYEIYNGNTLIGTTSGLLNFTINNLIPNTSYLFKIIAEDKEGNKSKESNVVSYSIAAETFSLKINFQPVEVSVPDGYLVDAGNEYGSRGNGFYYGWNTDYTSLTRDRNINTDQRLDTLCVFGSKAGKWEIAVPNGFYKVKVCVGDAGYASNPTINVEGINYMKELNLGANQFKEKTKTISVIDGRITIDQGEAVDRATTLSYVEIYGVAEKSIDIEAPSSPANLMATSKTATTLGISWDASTDNVGVARYDIYNNDVLIGYTMGELNFLIKNLIPNTIYKLSIVAKDNAGNESLLSNAFVYSVLPQDFNAKINFQPINTNIPEGYLVDDGSVYVNRGNGFIYGWNIDYTSLTRDRNINTDQRLDTFCMFGSKSGKWEISVPNGTYEVNVSVGDAGYASNPTLNVEGVNYCTNVILGTNKYLQITKTITVTDGKISVDQGNAANRATCINYIEIIGKSN